MPSRGGPGDRKTLQLCRQVERTLSLAICELEEPLLQACWVIAVEPFPDDRQLRVVLGLPADLADGLTKAQMALLSAQGKLRSEVAAGINRRATPNLIYELAPETPPGARDSGE